MLPAAKMVENDSPSDAIVVDVILLPAGVPLTVDGGTNNSANAINITDNPGADLWTITSNEVSTQLAGSPVTINLGMSALGQGSLSQSSLIFDVSTWNVAQTVTVTGLNDHISDGNQNYQITGNATSADANYNALTITPVNVTNR